MACLHRGGIDTDSDVVEGRVPLEVGHADLQVGRRGGLATAASGDQQPGLTERGVGDHRLAQIGQVGRRDVGDRDLVRLTGRVIGDTRVLREPGAIELGGADLELAA